MKALKEMVGIPSLNFPLFYYGSLFFKLKIHLIAIETPVHCNAIQYNTTFIRSSSLKPVLSCIYLFGGGTIQLLLEYIGIHKLFSICNRVVLDEPQYKQAAIRFHRKNIYLSATLSADFPITRQKVVQSEQYSNRMTLKVMQCDQGIGQTTQHEGKTVSLLHNFSVRFHVSANYSFM